MDMDIRDRLSLEEYVEISDRRGEDSSDYDDWYLDGWCKGFGGVTENGLNAYGRELYDTEMRKRQIRLLQEALDV